MRPFAAVVAVAVVWLGLGLFDAGRGLAQAPEGLFEDAVLADALAQSDAPPHVFRQRFVTARLDRLAAPQIALNLFPDVSVTATVDRIEPGTQGFTTWIGHVDGEPVSLVSLTAGEGVLVGTIQIGRHSYEVRPADSGVLRVTEIDVAGLPREAEPRHQPLPLNRQAALSPPPVGADDGSTIDVLVLFNRAARENFGGASGLVAWVNQQIANGNTAYLNSGIIQRLRVVGIRDVNYTQSEDVNVDLNRLQGNGDGHMDEVFPLRNAVAADIVHLVLGRESNACGVANLMTAGLDAPSFESLAYSLSATPCSIKHVVVHEIGHTMGANHAAGDPVSASPLYPYAFGYKNPGAGWRTLMAYECIVNNADYCPRILHFSNPARRYGNQPTGTADTNNALVHNVNRVLVSNFRAANGKMLPGIPGKPTVVISGGQATVSWTAPTFGAPAASYTIQVGRSVLTWDLAEINVGSSLSFRAAAPPRGLYYVRVVALNQDGYAGAASDELALQVGPTAPPNAPRGLNATVSGGNTVTLTWLPPAGGPEVSGYVLQAGVSAGGTVAGFPSTATALSATGPDGTYFARVRAVNELGMSGPSNEVSFRLGVDPPNPPINLTAAVRQSRVDLFWSSSLTGGTPEGFILEAGSSSGARNLVDMRVGRVTTFSAAAPTGRYFVRVRAYNRAGISAPSNEIVVTPDATACTGDISATLSWNTPTDVDLHVIEPNGSHVYYARKQGTTARLDRDNTTGYGPENICVAPNASAGGVYEVFVVPYSGSSYPTTATVTVRTKAGTANERYQVITRTLPAPNTRLGYRVAVVNGQTGTITEISGTRVPPARPAATMTLDKR